MNSIKIKYSAFLIVIVIYFVNIFNGCNTIEGSDTPQNAVNDFIKAIKEQNFDKVWSLISTRSKFMYGSDGEMRGMNGKDYLEQMFKDKNSLKSDFEILGETNENDSTVIVNIKTQSDPSVKIFTIKENNVWKVDLLSTEAEIINQTE